MATQSEVAAHLDLTDRSIRELIGRGILPTSARGLMDVDRCRVAYIRHLREAAAGRATGPSGDDLTAERARLAKEQADHFSLKNGAMRLELLSKSEITRAVTAAFQHVRDGMTALPAKLTTVPELRAAFSKAIDEVLSELSESRIVASAGEMSDAA